MPFPWKKAKPTRIARLVAGLNRSSKRGGSLVVETGFPTSLIDIFVKNRDRLRKSSRRKSSSSPQILTLTTHTQSDPTRSCPSPPCNEEPDTDVRESVSITRENYDEKIAFHLACKIFLMVALAVSTRNFAIWFMMAAFLLVLIEFVGSRFLGFSRPDSLIRTDLKSRADDELVAAHRGTDFTDPCRLIELEEGRKMETVASKSEPSRSERIKTSLIKKFVPKKLRQRKRKNQGKLEEGKRVEENEELEGDESEIEPIIVSTCDQNLQVESAKENLRKGKSGCSILFFVVILAGLVGGRGVALLLTLLCCLMILIFIGKSRKGDSGGRKT